jgi:hypothetical protein
MKNRYQLTREYEGGCLLCYARSTLNKLTAALGPQNVGLGDKTENEWNVMDTQTGETYSIYDWKGAPFSADELYTFHIGGFNSDGAETLASWLESL